MSTSSGNIPSPSIYPLTSGTESHDGRSTVRSAGAGIPNQSCSDFDINSLLFQNIPNYSNSQGVFNDSAHNIGMGNGHDQPTSKNQSLRLSPKLKSVIQDFIRNGNEKDSVPGGEEWMKSLFLKLKRHDTRVSFNDVFRWTKTHAWIIADSYKARNQIQNQNQSYPPTASTTSMNLPLAELQSQSNIESKIRRQKNLKKCLEIKSRLLALNDDLEEVRQLRTSSIMFQKVLPGILGNLARMEKRAITGFPWEERPTRAEQQMNTATNDEQGQGQGQGQTISHVKVEHSDREDVDVDHSDSERVELLDQDDEDVDHSDSEEVEHPDQDDEDFDSSDSE